MRTLILSSSFTTYTTDANKNRVARVIDNDNGFRETLQKIFCDRKCMVIISGDPLKQHKQDPTIITKQSFEMSGIPFDEYIYVNNTNKHRIKEYIQKATAINLFGGHLPTANAFVQELNLKELLKDFRGVVIGASGGAMNLADKVYCIPEEEGEPHNPLFQRFLEGIALTNIHIIPHYNLFKKKIFADGTRMLEDILLPDSYTTPMVALPDRSYIVQQGNTLQIFGDAFLIKKGKIKSIKQKSIPQNHSYFFL